MTSIQIPVTYIEQVDEYVVLHGANDNATVVRLFWRPF
jgi:hypothetical protein